MFLRLQPRRRFSDLTEAEILALAVSAEEEDARIYNSYAAFLHEEQPASADMFHEMAREEDRHRARLIERFRARFGETLPLVKREHVAGFPVRQPLRLNETTSLDTLRAEARLMEQTAERFYRAAAKRTPGRPDAQAAGRSRPMPRPATTARPPGWKRPTSMPKPARQRTTPPTAASC